LRPTHICCFCLISSQCMENLRSTITEVCILKYNKVFTRLIQSYIEWSFNQFAIGKSLDILYEKLLRSPILPKCCAALERLNSSCRLLKLNYLALFILYYKIIYVYFIIFQAMFHFPSSQFLIRTDERVILTVPL